MRTALTNRQIQRRRFSWSAIVCLKSGAKDNVTVDDDFVFCHGLSNKWLKVSIWRFQPKPRDPIKIPKDPQRPLVKRDPEPPLDSRGLFGILDCGTKQELFPPDFPSLILLRIYRLCVFMYRRLSENRPLTANEIRLYNAVEFLQHFYSAIILSKVNNSLIHRHSVCH